jgi:phospholipid-binding lipoprotein MlaA
MSVHAGDPFENWNRKVQRFNDVADEKLVQPVARGYQRLPDPVRFAAGNVYGNLADAGDMVNNLLQGKPGESINDLFRVAINSTIGLGGLFDPASRLGLEDHQEDFAQTLATWRIPRGPYLVLPLLGPSSVRDAFARPVDSRLDPLVYLYPVNHRNTLLGMRLLHERAELLAAESAVFGDRYIFFREAFRQRREYLEQDGEIEDPFDEDF